MIKFLIVGQQLKIVTPIVVADTHNYHTAIAVFRGSEWEACSKWAHFVKDDVTYDVPFYADEITQEQGLDLTAGTWRVYIHGNVYDAETDTVTTRITTSTALLKVESAEADNPFPAVTPSFAEVLAAQISHAIDVANGIVQAAAAGAFDGATFTPQLDGAGDLSWSNDKGKPNPATVNLRGPAGKDGSDFQILGYYESFSALTAAVAAPNAGDAYGIGTEEPYDIYIYDTVGERWINNGPVQGAKGDPGQDATIESVQAMEVAYGTPPSVLNIGTPSAAKLVFYIPNGKVPVKGVDYFTSEDKEDLAGMISPGSIGAVADPEIKETGQYLKWNGTSWEAADVEGGVSSVNGSTGEIKTRLRFENKSVAASAFTKQSTPTYADFPYVASIACAGVTAQMVPDVVLSSADAESGNFSLVASSYTGGVYIYAHSAPTAAISIPVIDFVL